MVPWLRKGLMQTLAQVPGPKVFSTQQLEAVDAWGAGMKALSSIAPLNACTLRFPMFLLGFADRTMGGAASTWEESRLLLPYQFFFP